MTRGMVGISKQNKLPSLLNHLFCLQMGSYFPYLGLTLIGRNSFVKLNLSFGRKSVVTREHNPIKMMTSIWLARRVVLANPRSNSQLRVILNFNSGANVTSKF